MTMDDVPPPSDVDAPWARGEDPNNGQILPFRSAPRDPTIERKPSQLPHNLEAEASILGGILLRNSVLGKLDWLEPDHFYDPRHKWVFGAMRNLQARATPIDVVTLDAELDRMGVLEAAGGPAILGELALKVPTVDNVAHYAEIVREHAAGRRALLHTSSVTGALQRGSIGGREAIEELVGGLQRILEQAPPSDRPTLRKVLGAMVYEARPAKPIRWYSTGIAELDELTGGGLGSGKLLVVCAPPGDGKSALTISVALYLEATIPALLVSTELETEEMRARVAGQILDMPWTAIERGDVAAGLIESALVARRIRVVGSDELPTDSRDAVLAIGATARAMAEKYDCAPLVVVDYLQDLVRGADEKSVRTAVGNIATEFRQLAQQLDGPMIVVSSVGRGFYSAAKRKELRKSSDARDYLSACKESGDIDYAAATILFLDVDEEGGGGLHRLARIAVAKARRGRPGKFAGAKFHGASGRWEGFPDAVGMMSIDEDADRRAAKVVDERVAKLVKIVTDWTARGTFKTASQVKDSRAVTSVGKVLDQAIESGELHIAEVIRMEGGKPKLRSVVLPVGFEPPAQSSNVGANT